MNNPVMCFFTGLIIGITIMWVASDSHVYLSGEQIEELTMKISENIRDRGIENTNARSGYEWAADKNNDPEMGNGLIDNLKEEIKIVIANELRDYKAQAQLIANDNGVEHVALTEKDYEQYYQAQSALYDAVNGAPMSFQQFSSDSRVRSLPVELRNKLMGEVAMKLTNGELNRDAFLGSNK